MWTYIYFALFIGTFVVLLMVLSDCPKKVRELERQRAELERQRAEIEVEEERIFDFLHGLGEAFSEGVRSSELHRLIVESAVRILDAHGGVLYLTEKNSGVLSPAFISKGCQPMVDVPQHVLDQAVSSPVALESFLRLHAAALGEGIIGQCWKSSIPAVLEGLEPSICSTQSTLVGPLVYRHKILGVLGLSNGPTSIPFSSADLNVFKAITEQGAFALYNEMIYFEAGEKKRLDHDLATAREIQSILLPSRPPSIPGYELGGLNIPAGQVSGDYFDYIPMDSTRLGVTIADVSGKGIPASLIMAMCRSVIRIEAVNKTSPSEVLRRVNLQLYPDIKEDMFISMVYLILDSDSQQVMITRAGHDAPLLYRAATGEVEKLNPKGMALGIDSGDLFNRVCGDYRFGMEKGDCILLYTDGVTESLDQKGTEYGISRLVQALQASAPHGASRVVKHIAEDVQTFVGNFPQHDDITLIAIIKT